MVGDTKSRGRIGREEDSGDVEEEGEEHRTGCCAIGFTLLSHTLERFTVKERESKDMESMLSAGTVVEALIHKHSVLTKALTKTDNA